MDDVKTEIVHQIADANWDHDRLVGSDAAQSPSIEMIKMGVRYENQINVW
jgi:hypothetical protein